MVLMNDMTMITQIELLVKEGLLQCVTQPKRTESEILSIRNRNVPSVTDEEVRVHELSVPAVKFDNAGLPYSYAQVNNNLNNILKASA